MAIAEAAIVLMIFMSFLPYFLAFRRLSLLEKLGVRTPTRLRMFRFKGLGGLDGTYVCSPRRRASCCFWLRGLLLQGQELPSKVVRKRRICRGAISSSHTSRQPSFQPNAPRLLPFPAWFLSARRPRPDPSSRHGPSASREDLRCILNRKVGSSTRQRR